MPARYEGLGVEQLVDLVDLTMRDKFADALAYQQDRTDTYDQERADLLDVEWEQVVLDEVPADNFHAGVLPSFVQTADRGELYPLVATVPGRVTPDPENSLMDQMGVVQNHVTVHVFSKATTPDLAYRKAVRMAEAAFQVVSSPPLIGKILTKIPDNALLSAPWKFFESGEDHGPELWWFAVGTDYRIKNYISPPQGV